jgi:hypothetical protein
MRGLEGRSREQLDLVFQNPAFFTPGRTVERIGEVADQAGRRADEGIESQLGLRGAAETQRQAAANLRAQGLQPLDISGVVGRLRQQAAQAEFVNPPRFRLLSTFADNLEARARSQGGVIDAAGLYELRKSMGDTVADMLGPVDPSSLQRRTAEIVGETTPLIDDAIEQAGGADWRQYLNTFTAGMRGVERQEFARNLERLPENRFEQVMAGNDPDYVSKVFGPGRYDINVELFGSQLPVAQRLAGEIGASRDVAASGLRELPLSMRLSLPTGARNRVTDAFQPGLKNTFARAISRIAASTPRISGTGVAADQLAREYSQIVSENAMRSLVPALASAPQAARLAGVRSTNYMTGRAVENLNPAIQQALAQTGQQYLTQPSPTNVLPSQEFIPEGEVFLGYGVTADGQEYPMYGPPPRSAGNR